VYCRKFLEVHLYRSSVFSFLQQDADAVPSHVELDELCVVFDSVPFAPLCEKHDVIHIIRSTKRIAWPPEEGRATVTGNMYRKVGKIRTSGF